MEEKEFIVGQWYKGEEEEAYYMKFEYEEDGNIFYKEEVEEGKYSDSGDYWANDDFRKFALEYGPVSKEEISPFLPEEHPDKIVPEKLLTNIL